MTAEAQIAGNDEAKQQTPALLAYSVPKVAEMLDMSFSGVRRLITEGRLKAVKIGWLTRVLDEDLRAFLESAPRGPITKKDAA